MYNRKLRPSSRALGDCAASCSCPSPGESDSAQTAPKRVSKSLSLRAGGEDAHSWSIGHACIGDSPFATNFGARSFQKVGMVAGDSTRCRPCRSKELSRAFDWLDVMNAAAIPIGAEP